MLDPTVDDVALHTRPGWAEREPATEAARPLDGVRVLDLTDASLQYCGKLFAQLGADVLLIEPPTGCATRREGPFLADTPHVEHSLSFAYLNQGKEGMCVDLHAADGRAILHRLAANADLLIHSARPDELEQLGLDFATLSAINPALVVTGITGFGLSGPYSAYRHSDLVAMALGGLLYLGGYPETEPVGAPGAQAYLAAAQFAAVASLSAVLYAESADGGGQLIDVSVQECVSMALENAVQYVDLEGTVRKRNGGQQRQAGTGVFPCSDGLVYLMAGGIASNRFWDATTQWLVDGGAPGAERLRAPEWNDPVYLASEPAKQIFQSIFVPFAATRTKAQLYEDAQHRRIPLCPVSTTSDLLENRQLQHRHYFQSIEHTYSGNTLMVPGAPFRFSATPWQSGRAAPRLGEHTAKVLGALGYDLSSQTALLRAGVTG
ncbi:MAG TPA: CoA transferase [Paraburkholderia sp.]